MRSVVGEVNWTQSDACRGVCSNGSSHNWLNKHRQRSMQYALIKRTTATHVQKVMRRFTPGRLPSELLWQPAAALPEDIRKLENEVSTIRQSLENHCQETKGGHHYFQEVTKQCRTELEENNGAQGKVSFWTTRRRKLCLLSSTNSI